MFPGIAVSDWSMVSFIDAFGWCVIHHDFHCW